MKKYILPVLGLIAIPMGAQNTIVDATRFGSNNIAGTARYRAMGGAFGALGGDPSSMSDNPAGMGVFRGTSEITFTPNLSFAHTTVDGSLKSRQKKVDSSVSNLAYIISFKTSGCDHLVNFNVGVGFNHSEGVDRKYRQYIDFPGSSFGAYLANRGNNTLMYLGKYDDPNWLASDQAYNRVGWMERYALGCYAIDQTYDEVGGKRTNYSGVESWDQHLNNTGKSTDSYQCLEVSERTRNDEYNLNFSANWEDYIYGGLTLTINDYNSIIESNFNEDYTSTSESWIHYRNNLETKGTGIGLKAGILIRPTDTWRVSFAAHTPTWYRMEDLYNGSMSACNEDRQKYADKDNNSPRDYWGGETFTYKYRYFSPWQLQVGSAWVIGKKALISLEADMKDFTTQKYKASRDGYMEDEEYNDLNDAIKDFNKFQMTYKAGAEYRVTKTFSVRAGYAYKDSPYDKNLYDKPQQSRGWRNGYYGDDNSLLFETDTKPNYTILGAQQFYTGGVGWSGEWWHIDISFMDRIMNEKGAAYPTADAIESINEVGVVSMSTDPNLGAVTANHSNMKTHTLTWDLTLGLKF